MLFNSAYLVLTLSVGVSVSQAYYLQGDSIYLTPRGASAYVEDALDIWNLVSRDEDVSFEKRDADWIEEDFEIYARDDTELLEDLVWLAVRAEKKKMTLKQAAGKVASGLNTAGSPYGKAGKTLAIASKAVDAFAKAGKNAGTPASSQANKIRGQVKADMAASAAAAKNAPSLAQKVNKEHPLTAPQRQEKPGIVSQLESSGGGHAAFQRAGAA